MDNPQWFGFQIGCDKNNSNFKIEVFFGNRSIKFHFGELEIKKIKVRAYPSKIVIVPTIRLSEDGSVQRFKVRAKCRGRQLDVELLNM